MSMTGIAGPFMVRKFSSTVSGLKQGSAADINVDCSVNGWVPLCIVDMTSSHAGSFCITQQSITSDGRCYATVWQPTNNWASVTINCTVLYVKEGAVASREYL